MTDCNPRQGQKQQTPFLPSLLSPLQQQNQVTSVSLERIFTNGWHSSFSGCRPRNGPPDYLALRANGACLPQPHSTVSDEVVLNRCRSIPSSPQLYLGPAERKQAKTPISQCFPRRGLLHNAPLPPEGPVSNQPASKCWLPFSLLGHWQVWADPQLLKPLRTRKVARALSEAWETARSLDELIRVIHFYNRNSLPWLERWLFYLMFGDQQKESKKTKKQEYGPNNNNNKTKKNLQKQILMKWT